MTDEELESLEALYGATGLRLWGSECTNCWNATPDSMRCDSCKSVEHTTPLWVSKAFDRDGGEA